MKQLLEIAGRREHLPLKLDRRHDHNMSLPLAVQEVLASIA
jgi:hypothetical protein